MGQIGVREGIMDSPRIKKNDQTTSISFYTLDNRVEDAVRSEIEETFNARAELRKNRDMQDTIYTCVKELMVNASSSNIRKTFFIEARIDEKNPELYQAARRNVRKLMNEHYLSYMRSKLQKHDRNVEVQIERKKDGIVVVVQNPTPLHQTEELEIRETFRKAMRSDDSDIAFFYKGDAGENGSPALGLLMIINLLRDLGVNPAYFRMGVVKNNTVARIEIPLSENYIGIRD